MKKKEKILNPEALNEIELLRGLHSIGSHLQSLEVLCYRNPPEKVLQECIEVFETEVKKIREFIASMPSGAHN